MSRTIGNTLGASMGSREACAEIVHTYPFSFNTPGITVGIDVDQVVADANNPVQVEFSVQVITAFNDSVGNIIEINSGTYLTVGDASVVGYYPASNAVEKFRLTGTAPITVLFAGSNSDATTGHAVLIVKEIF